jgi:hypothetical protein
MKNRQTPSALFLIAVNALVLFGVTTIGISDPRTFTTTILLIFLPLFLVALLGQGVVFAILRSRPVGDGTRSLLFLLPVVLVVAAAPLLSPSFGGDSRAPLPSPSADYLLEVPIQQASWTVRILDREGKQLHEDRASEFYGRFNSYWAWDESERAWLLNTDTGEIYFWELADGSWRKERWGMLSDRQTEREIDPPSGLFPPHVAVR